jgi:hypothetical protein
MSREKAYFYTDICLFSTRHKMYRFLATTLQAYITPTCIYGIFAYFFNISKCVNSLFQKLEAYAYGYQNALSADTGCYWATEKPQALHHEVVDLLVVASHLIIVYT